MNNHGIFTMDTKKVLGSRMSTPRSTKLADEHQWNILCELLLAVMKFCQNADHWKKLPKQKRLEFLEKALSEFSIGDTNKSAELEKIANMADMPVKHVLNVDDSKLKKKTNKKRFERFGQPPPKKIKKQKKTKPMSIQTSHGTQFVTRSHIATKSKTIRRLIKTKK